MLNILKALQRQSFSLPISLRDHKSLSKFMCDPKFPTCNQYEWKEL